MKLGDVVTLKSGGPPMTVTDLNEQTADCSWFGSHGNQSAMFRIASLTPFTQWAGLNYQGPDGNGGPLVLPAHLSAAILSEAQACKGYPSIIVPTGWVRAIQALVNREFHFTVRVEAGPPSWPARAIYLSDFWSRKWFINEFFPVGEGEGHVWVRKVD